MTQFHPVIFMGDGHVLPFRAAGFSGCPADRVGTLLHDEGFVTGYEITGGERLA